MQPTLHEAPSKRAGPLLLCMTRISRHLPKPLSFSMSRASTDVIRSSHNVTGISTCAGTSAGGTGKSRVVMTRASDCRLLSAHHRAHQRRREIEVCGLCFRGAFRKTLQGNFSDAALAHDQTKAALIIGGGNKPPVFCVAFLFSLPQINAVERKQTIEYRLSC